MTGIKIAVSSVGIIGGGSASLTGLIIAQVPAVSADTSVNMTLALVGSGLATVAVLSWKVSRAWSKMEAKVESLEGELRNLRKGSE